MTKYEGNTIYHTHGDTLLAEVGMDLVGGGEYEIEAGDTVTFSMRKEQDTVPLIVKEVPTDTLVLRLEADETEALDSGEVNGHYVYDIKLRKADGYVCTFINMADLYILEEV